MKKKSEIHNYFQSKKTNDNEKEKVSCIYCNYVIIKNATRMCEHLQKCEKCPEALKHAEFLTRRISFKKVENIKTDDSLPELSEPPQDWETFSNDDEEEDAVVMTPPRKRSRSVDKIPAAPLLELEDTHVDYFFKSLALQVKTANLSQQNFIDLQINFLNIFSAKMSEYKKSP